MKLRLGILLYFLIFGACTLQARQLGLSNGDCHCFMNASLQCITHTRPLMKFLDEHEDYRRWPVQLELYNLKEALKRGEYGGYNVAAGASAKFRGYVTSHISGLRSLAGTSQEDASEFITPLLDSLITNSPYHSEISRIINSPDFVDKVFFPYLTMYRTTVRGQYFDHQENLGEWFDYNARDSEGNPNVKKFAPQILHTSLVRDLSTPTSILYSQIASPLNSIKILYNVFHFDVWEKMEAEGCPHPHTRFECFGNLFVSVPKKLDKPDLALTDCLTKSLDGQIVKGAELKEWGKDTTPFRCAECNKVVQATTKIKFSSLPQILTIVLKRFLFGFGPDKILTPVTFEQTLNVGPYLSDALKVMIPGPVNYHLYGIVIHHGGTGGGHYFAYAKDEGGHWYCYNDSGVSGADGSIAAILAQTQEIGSPYILFYERDPAIVGPSVTGVPVPLIEPTGLPVPVPPRGPTPELPKPTYTFGTFINETNDSSFLMASFTALAHVPCFYDLGAGNIADACRELCANVRRGNRAISLKDFKDKALTNCGLLRILQEKIIDASVLGRMVAQASTLVADVQQVSLNFLATYNNKELVAKIESLKQQEAVVSDIDDIAYIVDQMGPIDDADILLKLKSIRAPILSLISIYKQFMRYLNSGRGVDDFKKLWKFCRLLNIGSLNLGTLELDMRFLGVRLRTITFDEVRYPLAPFFLGEQNAGAFVEQLCTVLNPQAVKLITNIDELKSCTKHIVIVNAQGTRAAPRMLPTEVPVKVGDYVVKSIVLHTGVDIKTGHYAVLVNHKGVWIFVSYQNTFVLEDSEKLLKNLEKDGTFFADGSEVYRPVVIWYEGTVLTKLSLLQVSLGLLQEKLKTLSERLTKLKY